MESLQMGIFPCLATLFRVKPRQGPAKRLCRRSARVRLGLPAEIFRKRFYLNRTFE